METQLFEPGSPIAGSSVKLVVGIFFVLLGLLMTLGNLEILDAGSFLRFWPALLIVIGVLKFGEAGSRALALILLCSGIFLLACEMQWARFSIFDLWPLILIGIGVVVVMHALGFRTSGSSVGPSPTLWAVCASRKLAASGRDLDGRHIIAVMGGCKIDVIDTEVESVTAVIEVIAVWGGIVIRVPDGWEVVGQVVPVMGGIDIKTGPARGGRKLIVRGLTLMGGMEIKNAKARTA
jgi:hypothetical protein